MLDEVGVVELLFVIGGVVVDDELEEVELLVESDVSVVLVSAVLSVVAGTVVVVASTVAAGAEVVGGVVVGGGEVVVVVSAVVPVPSRESMPPMLPASVSIEKRSVEGSSAAGAPALSSGSIAANVDSSARTAWSARGAATPAAVTVDSDRARRNRVRPTDSRRWYRAIGGVQLLPGSLVCGCRTQSICYICVSTTLFYRLWGALAAPAGRMTQNSGDRSPEGMLAVSRHLVGGPARRRGIDVWLGSSGAGSGHVNQRS